MRVAEDAEGCTGGEGGEDVADELIAGDAGYPGAARKIEERVVGEVGVGSLVRLQPGGAWMVHPRAQGRRDEKGSRDAVERLLRETVRVEDGFEVAIAFDEGWGGGLEIAFGELGFEVQGARRAGEGEVDFGAVEAVEAVDGGSIFATWTERFSQRDPGAGAEAGLDLAVDIENGGDGGGEQSPVEDAGVAEDVHEQGVGAGCGVKFHPSPVMARTGAAGGGVRFRKAAQPFGVGAYGSIGGRVEVAVVDGLAGDRLAGAKEDGWRWAGAEVVLEVVVARVGFGTGVEVAAELRGGPGRKRHCHQGSCSLSYGGGAAAA